MLMAILHELLCAALLYSCFCRAVKTNQDTRQSILLTFYFLSCVAIFATFAPLVIDWKPDIVSLLLLLAITLVQTVTATHWRYGPPEHFQQPDAS